ncbi:hypothetical protein Bbelb_405320 [Branchiostoma belcheri]|nr:hypothetical protein Bbelb_405320 [Branchiostoma belcheri]
MAVVRRLLKEGQLGHGEEVMFLSEPTRIRHDVLRGRVVQISCGESYSAALTELGELYMWGKNSHIILPDQAATTGSTVHTGFTQEVSVCAGSCAGLGTPQLSLGGQVRLCHSLELCLLPCLWEEMSQGRGEPLV